MDQEIFRFILESEIENYYLVVVLGMVRAFGLMWGFTAFGWAFGSSMMLRATFALAIGLPLMVANVAPSIELARTGNAMVLSLLSAKEFGIGFGLGLLASAPFRALQYAGGITDAFRGESESGLQSPDGTTMQTFSVLYLIIGFYVFAAIGGYWKLVGQLYGTYQIWPLERLYPALTEQGADIALEALDNSMKLAVIICAPLLILLAASEFVLMIAAKLARRFGIYDLSFLLKNLITVVTLPLIAHLIVRVAENRTPDAILGVENLRRFLE